MRRALIYAKWTLASLIVLTALVWIGDAAYVRERMAHKTEADPLDTIKIRPLYVVPLKDGRAELDFGDPQTQMCVHSLFPQLGYDPCWYVIRQSKKPIPIARFLVEPNPVPFLNTQMPIVDGRYPVRPRAFLALIVPKSNLGDNGYSGRMTLFVS